MRLLVLSDSHKNGLILDRVIRRESDASHIFFLGDNTADIEDLTYEYTNKCFYIVSGNCDYIKDYPDYDIVTLSGKTVFLTHGHKYSVKGGTGVLSKAAMNFGADIALYGHTHIPKISYENGLYIVNPGSLSHSRSGPNSYAVIDIEQNGIMPIIKTV